jgi:hypothetical protein
MANAEHAEIIEHAEKPDEYSGIFRLFHYFRVFRVLCSRPKEKKRFCDQRAK